MNLKELFKDDLYGYAMKKAIKDSNQNLKLKNEGMDYHNHLVEDSILKKLDEKFMSSEIYDLDTLWDAYKIRNN